MRSAGFVLAIMGLALAAPAAAETLANEQIIQLAGAGLADQVLIAKIRASDTAFDTSTEGLLELRRKGVSNPVIMEMIATSSKPVAAGPATASGAAPELSLDSPDPDVPHPPGIYLLADWRSPTRMVPIPAITRAKTRNGNLIAYVLSGGIAKRSRKAVLPEAGASIQTPRSRPIFYFYSGAGRLAYGSSSLFGTAEDAGSPADFNLVRFRVDKDGREAKIGASNILGSSSGVAEKDSIPFTHTQVSPGVYRVQPESELEGGEYGFIYSAPNSGKEPDSVRIFDFSVEGAEAR